MTEPSSNLPAQRSLDRAALERVLQRAAELQARAGDVPDEMTEDELVALGQEVGLTPETMRQAIAEERTRVALPESEHGLAARLFGPGSASAARTVNGTPAVVLRAVDEWMQREECLKVKRRFADRITWEPRRDFLGNVKRGLNLGGRGYFLTRATEVAATVIAVDDKRSLVRLDADLTGARSARASAGVTSTGLGAVGAATLTTVAVVANVALIPALLVGVVPALIGGAMGYRIVRDHEKNAARAQLALEQVLDRLEHGETGTALPLWKQIGVPGVPPSVRRQKHNG